MLTKDEDLLNGITGSMKAIECSAKVVGNWFRIPKRMGALRQADRNEQRNLAGKMTDKVRELSDKYDAWAAKCEVRPWELTKK